MKNRRIVLASRPVGIPVVENFREEELPLPQLQPGQVLLRNRYFTIDPASRNFMDDRPGYRSPLAIGERMRATVLGTVEDSRNDGFRPGQVVRAYGGWESFSIVDDSNMTIERLEPNPDLPLSAYLGAVGWSGIAAYVGLHEIGRIAEGETVVVSAASGAVGGVAGQVAKLRGCRTVGVVGSAAKAEFAKDVLGYDDVVARENVADLNSALAAVLPNGADLYFDNVGGPTLDAMLTLMRERGRIAVCGMISTYNSGGVGQPIQNLWQILVRRLTMRGFLAYECDHKAEAVQELERWATTGALRSVENVTVGIENAPRTFIRMLTGSTLGKTLIGL